MKRLLTLISTLALILTASATFATQESTWGTLKQLPNGPAAKKIRDRTLSASNTTTTTDTRLTDVVSIEGTTVAANRTVSQWVYPNQEAILTVTDNNGTRDKADDLKLKFRVPAGGVTEAVQITMTLNGTNLSDLEVVFQPGGLNFVEIADLDILVSKDRVDVPFESLTVNHIYMDGTVEETQLNNVKYTGNGNTLIIEAEVPGFSRYGLSGGF